MVHALIVSSKMKALLSLSFLLTFSCVAAAGGRASVFEHIDSRWKMINRGEHHVHLTGREDGLMLQCPKKSKISFPEAKSAAVAPNGRRINLKCKSSGEKLPGFWTASFDPPHAMIEGTYHYSVTIIIDGKERTFDHVLSYSFEKIEPNHSEATQR